MRSTTLEAVHIVEHGIQIEVVVLHLLQQLRVVRVAVGPNVGQHFLKINVQEARIGDGQVVPTAVLKLDRINALTR